MTVVVRFPDADPETNSVDGGAASWNAYGNTWDQAHDSGGDQATIASDHVLSDCMIRAFSQTNKYDLWRSSIDSV